MKRKQMVVLYAIAVAAVAVVAWYVYRYFNSPAYYQSRLPEQFNTYPALNAQPASLHRQIRPLLTGAKLLEVNLDKRNNVIVLRRLLTDKTGGNTADRVQYYRLDKRGNLLDSLMQTGNEAWAMSLGGHLLYKDHYCDYPLGGGTAPRKYVERNADLSMEGSGLEALVESLQKAATASRREHVYDEGPKRQIFFFSVNGEVHKVHAPYESAMSIDHKFDTAFAALVPVTARDYDTGRPYNWEKAPLLLAYFLKESYNRPRRPGIMAPAPMNVPRHWDGTGYFQLCYPGDTLLFKHPITFYPEGPQSYYDSFKWGKLDYFAPPGFDVQLLTVGFETDYIHPLDGCYIVLPRSASGAFSPVN